MLVTTPPVEPVIEDGLVIPLAQRLLACLCAELETSLAGSPCQCCLRPGGALPPMDACCACSAGNGQASVQVTSIYPSTRFPTPGISAQITPCGAGGFTWAAQLTLVVYRCVATVDDDGSFPSCAELDFDARKILSDAAAMRRAVSCCDWPEDAMVIPEQWVPVPPQGGCAGGRMSVLVDLGPECCPDLS